MAEAAISFLAAWQNFYVIIGAAAATLTGLMFVAISLVASAPIEATSARMSVKAFVTPIIVHFCAVLLVAAVLSAPWPALWNAGLVLFLLGLAGVSYMLIVIRRMRHQTDYQPAQRDWIWYISVPIVAYIALVGAAIVLPGNPVPALFIIATFTLVQLFTGIRNAWDSVTYVAIERSHPDENNQE